MNTQPHPRRPGLAAVLLTMAGSLLALPACSSPGAKPAPPAPAPPAASASASSNELFPPIQALIGDARCSSDQQCRSIGVGHKPCGGPGGYLAWSTQSTPDEAALRTAVERHAKAQREEQERAGMLSNCIAVRDPGARCVAEPPASGVCKLNAGPGGGAR